MIPSSKDILTKMYYHPEKYFSQMANVVSKYFSLIVIVQERKQMFLISNHGCNFFSILFLLARGYFDYEFVKSKQTSMSWQMINLHQPLQFRYYSRDLSCSGNYSLIAQSVVIEPLNYNELIHIHLAYGDRLDQIFVSYLTNSSQYPPQCQYGFDPFKLEFYPNGTTTTYTESDMYEGKANIWTGNNEHDWSSIYSFTNRSTTKNEAVTLIAYGDIGLSPVESGAKPTVDRVTIRIISTNITCLLHIGDISYARAPRVPYMVGIGNHEYDNVTGGDKHLSGPPGLGEFRLECTDSGGELTASMVHCFHSPSNGNGLFRYSFDVGPIHIIYYSTEHDFRRSSLQYMN
ncbi:unnamed protein product [Rotaria sp. Silwood2]|nr:unnamed protein product [Rotaria sp. Silwood2]CAF2896596.1 unnamed protein product [Rotaria sp. Silwood2]CAF3076612.1 unnamed protein product [Rotaria sp. Silwood2]CAF4220768.1 unnamed protein product [Rotaria sp. Silwood2]CAF4261928.1 unnamed protein product [Rotaria sp. Silwood2]